MNNKHTSLIAAIVFASIVVAGSLIFFGLQISDDNRVPPPDTNLSQKIEQGIADFLKKQQKEAENSTNTQKKISANNLKPLSPRDHIRGNTKASITLVEYSDFECPFCKRFHPTMNRALKTYPNKVNWVFRHFPLGFHEPLATQKAEAVECANKLGGNEKFWAYVDKLFEGTKKIRQKDLPKIALEMGLDQEEFQSCLDSGKMKTRVITDVKEGIRAGVTGTPGNFLIDNRSGEIIAIPGAVPFSQLSGQINTLLQKSQ